MKENLFTIFSSRIRHFTAAWAPIKTTSFSQALTFVTIDTPMSKHKTQQAKVNNSLWYFRAINSGKMSDSAVTRPSTPTNCKKENLKNWRFGGKYFTKIGNLEIGFHVVSFYKITTIHDKFMSVAYHKIIEKTHPYEMRTESMKYGSNFE